MNWYKKAQVSKSIPEAEQWIKQYAKTSGGKRCLIYGQCTEFAEDFMGFLNDPDAEYWSLWEIYDDKISGQLPFVNSDSLATEKVIGKDVPLCDVGFESHVIIKWNGFWWDGYGKQSLDQIMKHFDKVRNPHWFRL